MLLDQVKAQIVEKERRFTMTSTTSTRQKKNTTVTCQTSTLSSPEEKVYHRLMVMANGDRALVARLIQYEAHRAPGSLRSDLIQTAIERWIRDHSRWD